MLVAALELAAAVLVVGLVLFGGRLVDVVWCHFATSGIDAGQCLDDPNHYTLCHARPSAAACSGG